MISQMVKQDQFHQKVKMIKAKVPTILSKRGLPSMFSRWRLAQDPSSGLVVLFAILNTNSIARQKRVTFTEYFEPRLLNELSNELQLDVVSCNTDGLRYAFILDRGQIDILPTHVDIPFLDGDRLFAQVVYGDLPMTPNKDLINAEIPSIPSGSGEKPKEAPPGVDAFLKIFTDINTKKSDPLHYSIQDPPIVDLIEVDKFNKIIAEYDSDQKRTTKINRLFNKITQK